MTRSSVATRQGDGRGCHRAKKSIAFSDPRCCIANGERCRISICYILTSGHPFPDDDIGKIRAFKDYGLFLNVAALYC